MAPITLPRVGTRPRPSPPHSSATGTAAYGFSSLTVTDTFKGTLGTVTIPPGSATFTYLRTVNNSAPGTCTSYDNTATIVQTSQTASQTVTVCNINTGALTMGFWKNTNGQKIINNGASTGGVCSSGTWLRQLNPFMDLSSTATCKQVATYVTTTIGSATCGGSTCNPMLRAQMLATALDVFFSTPGLGGNQIGGYNGLGGNQPALGGVAIDLSHVCSMADSSGGSNCTGTYEDARPEFGIAAPCLGTTVANMLGYANANSALNGSPVATPNTGASWYNQNKARQVFAKDGFDNINNQIANIAPTSCSPTF